MLIQTAIWGNASVVSHRHAILIMAIFIITVLALATYQWHVQGAYIKRYREVHHVYIPWTYIEQIDSVFNQKKPDRHYLIILFERQTDPELERLRRWALFLLFCSVVYLFGGGIPLSSALF